MNRKITILLWLLLLTSWTAQAQWEPLNPGAGGQVQNIVGDPNTPGRLFLASDMEGIYESTDNGLSWKIKGDMIHNRVFTVAVSPGNANKIYTGTMYGLEVSNDGGKNFDLVELTRRQSIASIAISPKNPNLVLAGIGWSDDEEVSQFFGLSKTGNGEVFRSTDGGQNWSKVTFNTNGSTRRNVVSIQFDPTNANIAYLGSDKGVYKSTNGGASWSKINGPSGTANNRGIAVSPDGKALYAAYSLGIENQEKISAVYATATASLNWQKVVEGQGVQVGNRDFWYPETDPRLTGSTHKLLIALQNSRPGLYEATFNWSGNTLSNYSWNLIWTGTDYGTGWDFADPNPRFARYTPVGWDRAIWSTSNQTIFQGVPNGSGYQWNDRYGKSSGKFPQQFGGKTVYTYSGRGTESTYTYDIAVDKNYAIQGQGDNGLMESWDYGKSWSNIQHRINKDAHGDNLSDVQAVDIGDAWGTPAVVAQAGHGYGGFDYRGFNPYGLIEGNLYAKRLDTYSPADQWVWLAGGPNARGGVPPGTLRDIAVAPAKPSRVFMFSTGNGMYMLDDLGWGISETLAGRTAWCTKISNGIMEGLQTARKISPHPTNPDIVYLNIANGDGQGAAQGVYRGEKTGPELSDWTWTKLYDGGGWDSEVSVWEHNGQVYMYYFGKTTESGGDGENFVGSLSLDEGETWKVVMNKEIAKGLRTNEWYNEIKNDFKFQSKGGTAGYDNKIIISYYDHNMQKAYGIYRGTISGNNVSWEDWTGDLHFGGLTATVIEEIQGQRYAYIATAGAGAWRRSVSSGGSSSTTPVAPSNLTTTVISGTQINLSWADNASNESGFKIERKQGSGTYSQIATVGANVKSFSNTGLSVSTAYTYRVRAYNAAGNSGFSNESSKTTSAGNGGGNPCTTTNLISNGEFDDGTNGWNFYFNTGGNHSATSVTGAGLSGTNAALLNIKSSNAGSGDSDIQFYATVGALQSGKTYQVIFQAKATGNRTMRVGVLQSVSPWTNFLSQNVTLTSSKKTYTLEFTMSGNATGSRLHFFVGGSGTDIYLDGVVVQEKCASNAREGQLPAKVATTSRTSEAAIYPNPVPASTPLHIQLDKAQDFTVQIVDLNGAIIGEKAFSSVQSRQQELDLQPYRPGVYLIRFQSQDDYWHRKLIIK